MLPFTNSASNLGFNATIAGSLPSTVTHIKFPENYEHHVDGGCLPPNLTHLYSDSVLAFSKIPILSKLIELNMDGVDNEILLLTPNLTHLSFKHFSKLIINFPPHLTHINFGDNFNQPVLNIPNSVISIQFGHHFNSNFNIPPNLTELLFTDNSTYTIPLPSLPKALTHLYLGFMYVSTHALPDSLTHLSIGGMKGIHLLFFFTILSSIVVKMSFA